MNHLVLAISIPPQVELSSVADYLTGIDLQWEYANPTFEDLFG
jgi:hypothetical protein